MKNAKIIGAFSGTGKSVVGAKYKRALDLDLGDYKFVYDEDPSIPHEVRKAMKEYKINLEWPSNYIEAIEHNKPLYDIILVSYCPEIKDIIDVYFTPKPSAWENLELRMRMRNNNEKYIAITKARLGEKIDFANTVTLGDDEYLEDALIREGLLCT